MSNIKSPELNKLPNIKHGFFTRKDGVSGGIYESLNCGFGSDDRKEDVMENRKRVLKNIGADTLCTLYQVHSSRVVKITEKQDTLKADGMVTNVSGIALGILTADCVPILFADSKKNIIGAAHAGWKGAKAGVVENTVEAMIELGASDIIASVGPHISKESYYVTKEFTDFFPKRFFNYDDRITFDIGGFVVEKLKSTGINNISIINRDTFSNEDNFFSYRRSTLDGRNDYGRQISAIVF